MAYHDDNLCGNLLFMLHNKQNPGMVLSRTITGIVFVKQLSSLFYQSCQCFLIVQADCGFYQLAAFENQQAGDAHDSKFFCQLRIIINVAFGNLDIAVLLSEGFQNRSLHTAGAAPGCPKINENCLGRVGNLLLKVCCSNF